MKTLLIFDEYNRHSSIERKVKSLETYLNRPDRLGSIYGNIQIDFIYATLPELDVNQHGVYEESEVMEVTSKYHAVYDAVGLVFARKGDKYWGNYYFNKEGGEKKMDFYVNADKATFFDRVEHELAGHGVSLDIGLTPQWDGRGYLEGGDNTHHFFYGYDLDGYYEYINNFWKKKATLFKGMIDLMSKAVEKLTPKKVPDSILPLTYRKWSQLVNLSSQRGINIKIPKDGGFRTVERQNEIWNQGRTTPGNIVTNAKGGESTHNFGIAIDYCFDGPVPFPSPEDPRWKIVNDMAEELGFFSYGNTFKWDYGHIQLMLDYSESDFRNGKADYSRYE